MTVQELIAELQTLPPDLLVMVDDADREPVSIIVDVIFDKPFVCIRTEGYDERKAMQATETK